MLCALAVGILVPIPDAVRGVLRPVSQGAIVVLFFSYGARLPTRDVLAGIKNVRLQGAILAMTYVCLPLLGLALNVLARPLLGDGLSQGLLYLTLLPSTIQSSVVTTGIARGNVAAAITAATTSNLLGMVLTPALVLVFMGTSATLGLGSFRSVLLLLLLPFIAGQLLQRWVGDWLRRHPGLTMIWDRSTIVLVVLVAVSTATANGVWGSLSLLHLIGLIAVAAVVLVLALIAGWLGGAAIQLSRPDRIALLMCGSQKSLATGMPMLVALFPAAIAGPLAIPVIIYHQLQLISTSLLARRLARSAS